MDKNKNYPRLNIQRPGVPLFGRIKFTDNVVKKGSILISNKGNICCICDVASANKIKIDIKGRKFTVRYYSLQRGIVSFDEVGGMWDVSDFDIVSL